MGKGQLGVGSSDPSERDWGGLTEGQAGLSAVAWKGSGMSPQGSHAGWGRGWLLSLLEVAFPRGPTGLRSSSLRVEGGQAQALVQAGLMPSKASVLSFPWLHRMKNTWLWAQEVRAGCWMLDGRGQNRESGAQKHQPHAASDCQDLKLFKEFLPSVPLGSINVPNKNGNLISIISSERKVTSTHGKFPGPGVFPFGPAFCRTGLVTRSPWRLLGSQLAQNAKGK